MSLPCGGPSSTVLRATLSTTTGQFSSTDEASPPDYQIPGQAPANTCGTVSAAGGGCYPFITFGGSGAGLMGTRGADGTLGAIDSPARSRPTRTAAASPGR
jgi:hypothetical protein